MQNFKPEGQTILTPSNQAALSSPNSLHEACIVGDTLEARALLCDKEHNLRVDLGCMYGIIPHNEGALGIDNGDFVFIDPKFTVTETGFLKSRFIDDKASAVLLLLLLRWCSEKKAAFRHPTRIYFVVFEEVGHGASALGRDVDEFVTVDMGCVGLDLAGNEYAVSICAKDSGGPYDYELTNRLIALAKKHGLPYTVDIFPFYGSDVGAAWHAGVDCKGALIGSGVCASHGMERTHIKGLEATLKLMYLYLCGEE